MWLNGQPLAQIDVSGAVYYYHNDHLGTPQRMTNSGGSAVWAADYLPFGQVDVTIETVVNNLRFAGQYYDSETGLHYNYWRFYDPKLGRYLRADPIGLAGGINPYAYVQNNPVNLIDPWGLNSFFFARPPITFRPSPAWRGPIGPRPPYVRPNVTPRPIPRFILRPPPQIIKPQPKPWYWWFLRLILRGDPADDMCPSAPPVIDNPYNLLA